MRIVRKCSQCGKTGHNSRTCRNGQSMKLFGVHLVSHVPSSSDDHDNFGFRKSFSFSSQKISSKLNHGSLCKGLTGATKQRRKKGVPWSEEEHMLFLLGLERLGKGDWRGIARNFVTTRTSTQVASHAQKYFLRQNNANKIEHRPPSLTPMVGRNEPRFEQVHRSESSISVGVFPRSFASTSDCIYSNKKLFTPPRVVPNCRLFNNSATQSLPSLELSLASPQAPAWNHRPIAFFEKGYPI